MGPFHVDKLEPEDIWGSDASDEGDGAVRRRGRGDRGSLLAGPARRAADLVRGHLPRRAAPAPERDLDRPLGGARYPTAIASGASWTTAACSTTRRADFCAIGVEVGDWLVLKPEERYACGGSDTSPTWDGESFQWPILEVGPGHAPDRVAGAGLRGAAGGRAGGLPRERLRDDLRVPCPRRRSTASPGPSPTRSGLATSTPCRAPCPATCTTGATTADAVSCGQAKTPTRASSGVVPKKRSSSRS